MSLRNEQLPHRFALLDAGMLACDQCEVLSRVHMMMRRRQLLPWWAAQTTAVAMCRMNVGPLSRQPT